MTAPNRTNMKPIMRIGVNKPMKRLRRLNPPACSSHVTVPCEFVKSSFNADSAQLVPDGVVTPALKKYFPGSPCKVLLHDCPVFDIDCVGTRGGFD